MRLLLGGVHYQKVKLTTGASGSTATLDKAIDTATGATDAGILAIATRDDALGALTPIEGDNVQLRVDANGALWTHDDALDAAISGSELQVDVVGALPAGTNAIGKLAANSGVDIGDVDILSIAAGDNNIGNVDVLSVIPGTGATNLGKAIDTATGATDTGILALATRDDALSALTPIDCDNVQLRTDANGALWTHDDALDAAISGSELQVDIVGALPAGTNAIGKLAANSGVDIGDVDVLSSALPTGASTLAEQQTQTTALQLIDNSIYVDDADWTADTSSHTLIGAVTQVATTANTDGDTTPLTTNGLRELRVAIPESDLATAGTAHVKKYYTSAGAATDGIVWSPAAGKRWYVTDLIINTSAAATVTLEDDLVAGDSAVMKFELAANSGITHTFQTPLFSGEDAADLLVTTSAGNIYITVTGYEI